MYWESRIGLSIQLLSYSCGIDDEFLLSVDPKQLSHKLVIKSSNGTYTTIDLLSRKIEVLANMAGIQVDQTVGAFAMPPCHAIGTID